MPTLPALPPSWDGFHPLAVHFPIALLAIAPIFVLLGAATGIRTYMVSGLLLLLLGVAGSFVASSTGEAAYAVMEPNYELEPEETPWAKDPYDVAEEHGENAEHARNIFAGIAVAYLVVVILAYAKPDSAKLKPRIAIGLVFLAALSYANVLMANAAHLGGELVHIHGVRANMAAPEAEEEAEVEAEQEEVDEADDDSSE